MLTLQGGFAAVETELCLDSVAVKLSDLVPLDLACCAVPPVVPKIMASDVPPSAGEGSSTGTGG